MVRGIEIVKRKEGSELLTDDDDNELESRMDEYFELGKVSMMEDLVERFREQSGTEYAKGDDDRAKWFRGLSESFKKEAEKARGKWSKKYRDGDYGARSKGMEVR